MYRGVWLMKKNKGPLSAGAAWRAKAARGTKRDDHAAGFLTVAAKATSVLCLEALLKRSAYDKEVQPYEVRRTRNRP